MVLYCWLSPRIHHLVGILAVIGFGGGEMMAAEIPGEKGYPSKPLAGWKVGIEL